MQGPVHAEVNDVIANFYRLKLDKDGSRRAISFKSFKHSKIDYFPREPKPFFHSSKEVAFANDGKLYDSEDKSNFNDSKLSVLEEDIAKLAQCDSLLEGKKLKLQYLNVNLYRDYDGEVPLMTRYELNDVMPCFQYIDYFNKRNSTSQDEDDSYYGKDSKYVIISARHHLNDICMVLYNNNPRHDRNTDCLKLNCIVLRGKYLVFSIDDTTEDGQDMINDMNETMKKICYSGFEFERIMTHSKRGNGKPIFSIVENKAPGNILLLLRCEMDAYNELTEEYSELKCFAPLSMGNLGHRKKLLKTWIQTGFIPHSDVVIGVRDTYGGLLSDIQHFSRTSLYHKFNNRNLPECRRNFNFNANIASEWLNHCINSIVQLIDLNIDKEMSAKPQAFQININRRKSISIKRLQKIPQNVDIPKKYL